MWCHANSILLLKVTIFLPLKLVSMLLLRVIVEAACMCPGQVWPNKVDIWCTSSWLTQKWTSEHPKRRAGRITGEKGPRRPSLHHTSVLCTTLYTFYSSQTWISHGQPSLMGPHINFFYHSLFPDLPSLHLSKVHSN